MDPDQQGNYYPSEQQPNLPLPTQPTNPYVNGTLGQIQGAPQQNTTPAKKSKKGLLLASVGALLFLILMIVLLIALSGNKKTSTAKKSQNGADTSQAATVAPADALSVEQVSNSISQDLSGLNDEQQLPATKIDDKALGL